MIFRILTAAGFFVFLFFSAAPFHDVAGQAGQKARVAPADGREDGFYDASFLKSDYREVDVVLYVSIKSRELVDSLGDKENCEQNKGGGYCLYRLKGEIKEVFKGRVVKKDFAFYTSVDADYGPKDLLLGEKVVFLNWSSNYKDGKRSLGTLENSTRSIESGVLAKMRGIARRKR